MDKIQTFKDLYDATIALLYSGTPARILASVFFLTGAAGAFALYIYSSKKLKDIFLRSFLDARGAADFKAITVFLLMFVFIASIPFGIATGKFIPDNYLDAIFFTIWIGFGADTAQNIQMMRAERKPAPPADPPVVNAETIENFTLTEKP